MSTGNVGWRQWLNIPAVIRTVEVLLNPSLGMPSYAAVQGVAQIDFAGRCHFQYGAVLAGRTALLTACRVHLCLRCPDVMPLSVAVLTLRWKEWPLKQYAMYPTLFADSVEESRSQGDCV